MIEWIIRRSVANRFLVMMGPCFSASGAHGRLLTRLSMPCLTCQMCRSLSKPAIPAAPQIVENRHLSTYHHHAVRAAQNRAWFSQFGDSYVYVILKTAPICTGPVPACWST